VYEEYSWQAYLGYTFVRFYPYSGTTVSRNGFTYSMAYFYKGGWLGADGEFSATFGSLQGQTSDLLLGMGGPRVRWSGPRDLQFFAHGLVGTAHFSPRTPFGNEDAFGYEIGGGADLPLPLKRLELRAGADMVATHFFSTFQYGPKLSVGLVYKF
jgi:hypothetical protein